MCPKCAGKIGNGVEPDQTMLPHEQSDLGLLCLPIQVWKLWIITVYYFFFYTDVYF